MEDKYFYRINSIYGIVDEKTYGKILINYKDIMGYIDKAKAENVKKCVDEGIAANYLFYTDTDSQKFLIRRNKYGKPNQNRIRN